MTKVLILGAGGQIARRAVEMLAAEDVEVSYEVTQRDEPFKGTEVSRKSVAALVTDIATIPRQVSRSNLGVNKPGTEGDKASFL